jgi:hypothetical protein
MPEDPTSGLPGLDEDYWWRFRQSSVVRASQPGQHVRMHPLDRVVRALGGLWRRHVADRYYPLIVAVDIDWLD